MRPIKFRAWHRGYATNPLGNPRGPQMIYDEKPGDCLVWLSQGQPVEIMQFTGFTDKDGRPIYEGDIIRLAVFGLNDKSKIQAVEWCQDYGGFVTWDAETSRHTCADCDWMYGCEVVGNVHENQELLK